MTALQPLSIIISGVGTAISVMLVGTGIILMRRKARKANPLNGPVPNAKVVGENKSTGSHSRDQLTESIISEAKVSSNVESHATTSLTKNGNHHAKLNVPLGFEEIDLDAERVQHRKLLDTDICVPRKQYDYDGNDDYPDDVSELDKTHCNPGDFSVIEDEPSISLISLDPSYINLAKNLKIKEEEDTGSLLSNPSFLNVYDQSTSRNSLGSEVEMEDDVDIERARKYIESRNRRL